MKPRHILLAAGVAIAAWLAIFGDTTPAGGITEPVTRAAAPNAGPPAAMESHRASIRRSEVGHEPIILSVLARDSLIGRGDTQLSQDRLFTSQTWAPPPPPPPPPPPKPAAPPPPVAPPLPFAYLGKKLEEGVWEVYLARGEQTFIVRPQSAIEGTYRVDAITPPTLSIVFLPLNQMQTLAIGGND